MSEKPITVTRTILAEEMKSAFSDLTSRESADLVNNIIEIMSKTLVGGNEIKVTCFGKFYLKDKNARNGRNPQTGEVIKISARRVLGFKASDALKRTLNEAIQ